MVLATIFVSLPFVVREVVPVLARSATEQEQAAETLGASPLQTFCRITLPAIRWGVAYGVVLTTARALGEFGAVSIVSGKLSGETETLTLSWRTGSSASIWRARTRRPCPGAAALVTLLLMNLLGRRKEPDGIAVEGT